MFSDVFRVFSMVKLAFFSMVKNRQIRPWLPSPGRKKAAKSAADVVVMDLEDSVAIGEKEVVAIGTSVSDCVISLWKITIFNGKIHYKWPFSIAMLNYQRVFFMGTRNGKLWDFFRPSTGMINLRGIYVIRWGIESQFHAVERWWNSKGQPFFHMSSEIRGLDRARWLERTWSKHWRCGMGSDGTGSRSKCYLWCSATSKFSQWFAMICVAFWFWFGRHTPLSLRRVFPCWMLRTGGRKSTLVTRR